MTHEFPQRFGRTRGPLLRLAAGQPESVVEAPVRLFHLAAAVFQVLPEDIRTGLRITQGTVPSQLQPGQRSTQLVGRIEGELSATIEQADHLVLRVGDPPDLTNAAGTCTRCQIAVGDPRRAQCIRR